MTLLRKDTLNFIYFCKFSELFFLIGLTFVIIFYAYNVFMTLGLIGFNSETEMTSTFMVPLIIFVTLHLFY